LTLLVGRQEGHPACKKTEWWCAGMVICLEQDADLHMAQLMPLLLTVSCSSKILCVCVFDYSGCPREEAAEWVFFVCSVRLQNDLFCVEWVQIVVATLSGNSLRQTVHTHCASVHQAAKLVAALLRVARVTAGLAESNGNLPPGL